jgi:hypothetical protein
MVSNVTCTSSHHLLNRLATTYFLTPLAIRFSKTFTMTEAPFKIVVSDEDIALLKKKLELSRFPDELENVGRDYGAPLKDIQRLVAYWKDGYDWRKHEAQLNEELPQFTRDIEVEGFEFLNVHYVHKKSSMSSAIPLLFVHGCE